MKVNRSKLSFMFIAILIGFMIAIQFKTVKEPKIRDTRDTWELRKALNKEVETQTKLLTEIRNNEERIQQYESEIGLSKEYALEQTLLDLKKEVGLTEIEGPGIIITIEALTPGEKEVSPIILRRLINKLNMYGSLHMSIDGERVINTTVIREINGETKIGNHTLRKFPIEIRVIVENAQIADKLHKRMEASTIVDDFFIDQLLLKFALHEDSLVIPAYTDRIQVKHMEPVIDKGD